MTLTEWLITGWLAVMAVISLLAWLSGQLVEQANRRDLAEPIRPLPMTFHEPPGWRGRLAVWSARENGLRGKVYGDWPAQSDI